MTLKRCRRWPTQDGANTVIDFGDGNVLTLNNVTLANLTASDFIFGVPL